MNHHKYLSIIAGTAIFAWIGWTLVLFKINPDSHIAIGLPLFFITFFLAISSTLTLIGYFLRTWLYKDEDFQSQINISFRQGILLAFIILFCTVFQIIEVLNWATAIILLIIILTIEFYFASKEND